jgi:hypothetical protein
MTTLTSSFNGGKCHNLNLRLMTKVKAYKGAGQEWSPKVTFYAPGGVGECEALNPRTSKWLPFWELEPQWTSKSLEGNFKGQNSLD